MMRRTALGAVVMAAAVMTLVSGCLPAITVESALRRPELSESQRSNLTLIAEIKRFAEERLDLTRTDNYREYQPRSRTLWVLTASPPDRLEPKLWNGQIQKTDLNREAIREEMDDLIRGGYDTHLRTAEAYSTRGRREDPVLPAMLDMNQGRLAYVIIHELAHSSVWSEADPTFGESFAAFVGEVGSEMFLDERYGPDSPILKIQKDWVADRNRYDLFIQEAARLAQAIYGQTGRPLAERRRELELLMTAMYEGQRPNFLTDLYRNLRLPPLSNAQIISRLVYSRTDRFKAAFRAVRGDWPKFLSVCREAAESDEPFARLDELIGSVPKKP